MKLSQSLDSAMSALGRKALFAGVAGSIASAILFTFEGSTEFFQVYLQSYVFWSGMAFGSLAILMVHHLCGGEWSFVIQRIVEASVRTIPFVALLFIPILMGMHDLYEWSRPDVVAKDEILQFKAPYLNVTGFTVRAVICFGIFALLGHLLLKWSLKQDETGDEKLYRPMRVLSGIGILIFFLAATVCSWDWTMSLEPHWFSSMWGPHFVISWALTALAFTAIILHKLSQDAPLKGIVTTAHFHNLGNLNFAFIILWTYMTFSTFIIIWSANLPEETMWYQHRSAPGWQNTAIILAIFHFVVPFFLLISRFAKLNSNILWRACLFILFMRFVDLHWLIGAVFHKDEAGHHIFGWSLLNLTLPIALGGFWIWVFCRNVRQHPMLPQHDTRFHGLLSEKGDAHHG